MSVSFDGELGDAARDAARRAGVGLSAWLAAAAAAKLRADALAEFGLRSNAVVVAQVWRGHAGRQAALARLLRAVEVCAVDERTGRDAGVLLGRAGTSDVVDATVALLARPGDRIVTSDPKDITRLVWPLGPRPRSQGSSCATGAVVRSIPLRPARRLGRPVAGTLPTCGGNFWKEVRTSVSDRGGGVRWRGERRPARGTPNHRR